LIGFRPEAARLGAAGAAGIVRSSRFLGSKAELELGREGAELLKIWTRSPVEPGREVWLSVAEEDWIRLPGDG
jgi:positive regulator of sigma E activity